MMRPQIIVDNVSTKRITVSIYIKVASNAQHQAENDNIGNQDGYNNDENDERYENDNNARIRPQQEQKR